MSNGIPNEANRSGLEGAGGACASGPGRADRGPGLVRPRADRPTRVRLRQTGRLVAFAAALTACGEVQAPTGASIDAARIIADHEALGGMIAAQATGPFAALAGRLPTIAPAGSDLAMAGASVPLISEANRGVTFVYDAALDRYVPDPSRVGAPANGVRFILYETEGERPDPSRETGYADFVDNGTDSDGDISLRLTAVRDGLAFLDYAFTVAPGEGRGAIAIDGFLRDAENRLEFAIDLEGSDVAGRQSFELGFELAMASRSFEAQGGITGEKDEAGASHSVDLTVRHGEDSIAVDAAADADAVDAGFYLNDKLFATARGAHNAPEILSADGDPLRPIEAVALHHVLKLSEAVFMLVECLGEPVGALIGLAVVL